MSKYSILLAALLSGAACGAYAADNNSDWLESYNRAMFNFNYQLDKYALKPLAKGYRAITPPVVRTRVNSALFNITEPVSAGNHVLQGSGQKAVTTVARFLINSTLGLAGMFDVAEGWGLKKERTNFDETLATWCVADGPFIVLPIFGPSTPRATVGLIVNTAASPVYWTTINDANYKDKISWSYTIIDAVASRERSLDLLDDLEKNSVDFYSTARSAYMQNRQMMKALCSGRNNTVKASYDFDFDDDDEEF